MLKVENKDVNSKQNYTIYNEYKNRIKLLYCMIRKKLKIHHHFLANQI